MELKVNVNKSECSACEKMFYEWDDALLKVCPHCKASLDTEKSANVIETITVKFSLDPVTGRVEVK